MQNVENGKKTACFYLRPLHLTKRLKASEASQNDASGKFLLLKLLIA